MKRVELLTALDDLDAQLEEAAAQNAKVTLKRSRERLQRWEDWMFSGVNRVSDDVRHCYYGDDEYSCTNELGTLSCEIPKVGLAWNVRLLREMDRATPHGIPYKYTHREFSYFGYCGNVPSASERAEWAYVNVENVRAMRAQGERELDHEGVYV